MKLDLSVYLVTERSLLAGRKLVDVVAAAIAGGATVVQLREKKAEGREFFELAEALLQITRPAGVPLLINDRVDVMLAADADGVHVGQEDLPADRVRRMIGPDKILGVTVADAAELDEAVKDGADYVGTNAVFATPTKTNTGTPQGLTGLREMCRVSPVPVVGIGGIDLGKAADVMAAGAAGCAVVRAIMAAPDPEAAARELARACRKP
ncbi:thiamine phosphate synthase [bacterium]|nr:thiamine phosphate synthase [bacterium]